ncbi:actin-binding LIM protein 2 [Lepeophtheirus salmonis]|uniref:actin-binding LIM protein 2 n=1 Tax=Lepeophtheirus salmonis TaxID=72036 RepID=UPI003AF33CB5
MPSSTNNSGPLATSSPLEKKKKKSGLSLSSLKSPFKFLGKTYCKGCKKKCSGEVLRVKEFYFHNGCFNCKGCGGSLSSGGYFTKDRDYYCGPCYQTAFGTKCFICEEYVEGEVVTALGNEIEFLRKTYHQKCFKCARCQNPFPTGERVTFTGKNCLCGACVKANELLQTNEVVTASPSNGNAAEKSSMTEGFVVDEMCAGCKQELKDGQALMALDKQYHVWCFKCKACGSLLHGEYMGKDGFPYCERDYQLQFGVKCTYCSRFISGKVLQAGDNNHFHPTCARCTKCGQPFGDGEEMFLQGAAIWHPGCGPGPDETGAIVNGFTEINRHSTNANHDFDRVSTVSAGIPPYGSRASSPGFRRGGEYDSGRFSRSTMHVPGWRGVGAIYNSSSTYSLRRPIEPGDLNMGSSSHLNHFHLPPNRQVRGSSRYSTRQSMDSIPLGTLRPLSAPPKPGYTQRSTTLPSSSRNGTISPGYHNYSDYYDGGRADMISQSSFRTTDLGDMRMSNTFSHGYRSGFQTPVIINHKTYPYHLIITTNYKMPPEVDRCNLEKHLNDEEFNMIFNVPREQFYTLPAWKKNDMKRRARLF